MKQENLTIKTRNGLVDAVLYKPTNGRNGELPIVIKLQGMPRKSPLEEKNRTAKWFTLNGFQVLAFDYTGVRKSPGIYGWIKSLQDIDDVITFIIKRDDVKKDEIFLFGESFGGAMSIIQGARDPRIKAIAIWSPPHDMREVASWSFFDYFWKYVRDVGAIRYPEGNIREMFLQETRHNNPIDEVERISPTPLYIMASTADKLINFKDVEKLYKMAKEPKQFKIFKGIDHNISKESHFEMISKTIIDFFNSVN